jgi:hypothetical protein
MFTALPILVLAVIDRDVDFAVLEEQPHIYKLTSQGCVSPLVLCCEHASNQHASQFNREQAAVQRADLCGVDVSFRVPCRA